MLDLGLLLFSQIHKIQVTPKHSLTTASLSQVFSLLVNTFLTNRESVLDPVLALGLLHRGGALPLLRVGRIRG